MRSAPFVPTPDEERIPDGPVKSSSATLTGSLNLLEPAGRLKALIRYGSCARLLREDECDLVIVLDKEFCKEGKKEKVCLPVESFSIEPLGNMIGAVAAGVDLVEEGRKVCVCDKGGCGRSGAVAAATLAYFHSNLNYGQLKKLLRNKYNLMRECPETREQIEFVKVLWGSFHYFEDKAFKLLARMTFSYSTFLVHVGRVRGLFLPVRALSRRLPYGKEATLKADHEALRNVLGPRTRDFVESYLSVEEKEGRVVRLGELEEGDVEPSALSFAAFEGAISKTLDPREALLLLTKSLA